MSPKAKNEDASQDVDRYLEKLSQEQRAALEKIRKTIRSAAPKATERISYGMPAFYQDGPLVLYAAWKDHLSLYGAGYSMVEKFKEELKGYEISKGTIKFTAKKPLPAGLIRKMVKTRVAENGANTEERRARARKRS